MANREICIDIIVDPLVPLCAYLVQLGMEEEGIPNQLETMSIDDPNKAAKTAADRSRLQVGVAVSKDKIVIHHQKLPLDSPILTYSCSEGIARLAGKNAARLVKGLPFDLGCEL